MTDQAWIHEVVGRVASEVLESHVAELREELVRRAIAVVQPSVAGNNGGAEKLLAAAVQVQGSSGQRDILNTLLEQTAGFCARSVLFVVKQESVTGWQAIGFADDEAVREFGLDLNSPLLRQVLEQRKPASGAADQMDGHFLNTFGAPVNGECHLLPLFLKDKVAAILYADAGGADASCERAGLDLLVRFTSLWLETQAARKSSALEHGSAPEHGEASAPAEIAHTPTQAVAANAAPSAGLSADATEWSHGAAASAAAAAPAMQPPVAPMLVAPMPVAKPTPAVALAEMSAADADTHKRAQRFARLLIDEIKLYNKAKLEEGMKQHDLYDRLRDDIDKSRATYTKRYGSTVAVSGDYFVQELIRGLAQGDASTLGPNFKH